MGTMAEKPKFFNIKDNTIAQWHESRKASATMQTKEIALDELGEPWRFHMQRNLRHDLRNSGKNGKPRYYRIVARKITASGREVDSYAAPGIEEVPDPTDPDGAVGTVGLLVDKRTGKILLQTAAEPFAAKAGSPAGDYLMVRASVQGSYGNLENNKVTFSDQVDVSTYKNLEQMNPSREFGKVRAGITYVDGSKIDLTNHPEYQWFSKKQINKAIKEDARLNGFLKVALKNYEANHKFRYRIPFLSPKDGKSEVHKRAEKKHA
jgi:hypothetical protein